EAALAGPPFPERPGPSDLLLQGFALRFTKGFALGVPVLKEAVRVFVRETDLPPEEARWLFLASRVALYLWDDDAWTALSTRQLDLIRDAGAMTALPLTLSDRIGVHVYCGELAI